MIMQNIGIGIIGTGFMGRTHALAYRAAAGIFPNLPQPVLEVVADIDGVAADRARKQYGFERSTTDWRSLVADERVQIVSITTPNMMHREMALAAIAAGKHVHCEKPLAPNVEDARVMTEAAEAAGIRTQTGFNYIKNPILKLARDMIEQGELGEITGFRGIHAEGFMSDPAIPYSWRLDPAGGGGAIADIGSHIIGMARYLLGPISAVMADLDTMVKRRPVTLGSSEMHAVEVDDAARLLVRFERGMAGSIEANWSATGRQMQLAFEISGSRGSIAFNQERLNELQFFKGGNEPGRSGFARIEAGPAHSPYSLFCIAGGHQLGFNDLKTIEVAEFLGAIRSGEPNGPDFREALEVQKVIEAAIRSSRERRWLDIA